MDAVSNTPYSDVRRIFHQDRAQLTDPNRYLQKEYARLAQTLAGDKKELPTIKDVDKIVKQLEQHTEYVMTEVRILPRLESQKRKG